MNILRCFNTHDFRLLAKKRLPPPVFGYMNGGADDEITQRRCTEVFDDYDLIPNTLVDTSQIDMSTRVLGADMKMPIYLSPTGGTRLFHSQRELAVARAAADAGIMYGLSTFSTTSIEDVAAAAAGPKMFQFYILKDRGLMQEFVDRVKAAGYTSICLTVDATIPGKRERDLYSGMNFPPKPTLKSLLGFISRPGWMLDFKTGPKFTMANIEHLMAELQNTTVFELANTLMDTTMNWDDAAWLAKAWGGPIAIKGLYSEGDAKRAVDCGATAAILSSHAGRQMDGIAAPLDRIQPIRDAVGDQLEILIDSGFLRGSHVIKALALGADAVGIGRPYLHALAAGGEAGVSRLLDIFRDEIQRGLSFMGVTEPSQLSRDQIIKR